MWNSPHIFPRYNFSFLLKYGYFEPSLPFQTTNLVQTCTAEESSISAPSPQSTQLATPQSSSGAAVVPTVPWKPGAPFEHYEFSSPSISAEHPDRHLYLQLPFHIQRRYFLQHPPSQDVHLLVVIHTSEWKTCPPEDIKSNTFWGGKSPQWIISLM